MMRRFLIPLSLILGLAVAAVAQEVREWIVPPALRPGDTIALVAPSRSVAHRDLDHVAEVIESWGYRVRFASNVHATRGNFAGDDAMRAAASMAAWLDPEVSAVWAITGGYGATRILDLLDFDAIRAAPKIFIGMSDITALHAAIGRETGLVTFLGPNGVWPLIRDELGPCRYAERWLWRAIRDDQYRDPLGALLSPGYAYEWPTDPRDEAQAEDSKEPPAMLAAGRARGRLVGGNLSLVAALVGTPWQIETSGRLLCLEDVREEPYRVDRMLCQLQLAGLLDDPAGVILCTWRGCESDEPDRNLSLEEVLGDYFADAPYPVMINFPSGHVAEQATLPLNTLAELNATDATLRLLENPVMPQP